MQYKLSFRSLAAMMPRTRGSDCSGFRRFGTAVQGISPAGTFRGLSLAAALFMGSAIAQPALAQGLFSPAITVNEDVITHYELEQRALFLSVIGTPGDPAETAREELILDALKREALAEVGLVVPEEAVTEGMRELAGRANLSLEDFLAGLKQAGVDAQTLRDFTRMGIGWRDYVRGRFLGSARPSEDEIDRAMGTSGAGSVQVLISEIFLPVTPETVVQVEDLAQQISQIRKQDTFSAAAGQFSAADSRTNGGRLPWMPITRLPAPLQEVVLALETNEVTDPLPLQGAVALFQMRGIREAVGSEPTYAAIDYVSYYIPGGRSPAALEAANEVVNRVDTCDDFYGIAKDQDVSVLERIALPPSDIPRDIALELAKMDPSETSTTLTRNNGETLMVLMLCGRTAEVNTGTEDARATVANALTQQRLTSLADSLLAQLKANARIKEE